MKIAVLLVGHENFGKSKTLVILSGSKSGQKIEIANKQFILKRNSNDDIGKEFYEYIETMAKDKSFLLLSFCPNFDDPKRYSEDVLKLLKRDNFKIYCFVLMTKYDEKRSVEEQEIIKLKEYADVNECYETDAGERAKMLKEYIEDVIITLEIEFQKQIANLLQVDEKWLSLSYGEYDFEVVIDPDNIEVDIQKNNFSFYSLEVNSIDRFGDSEDNDPEYFGHSLVVNGNGKFEYSEDKVNRIHITITQENKKDIKWINDRKNNNTPRRLWHGTP